MPTLSESDIRKIHNLETLFDFLRAQCEGKMQSALSDETLTASRKKVEAHIKATYLSGASARGSETGFESVDGVELSRDELLRMFNGRDGDQLDRRRRIRRDAQNLIDGG